MTEYAIFCARDGFGELDIERPTGTISYDGKSVVITGPESLIQRWKPYFGDPGGGWGNHSGTKRPLTSLFGSMTYDIAIVVDGSRRKLYETAVAALGDAQTAVVEQGELGG